MPLSEEQISNSEDVLNRIATELVLANAGSDDGLVPVYALVNELMGLIAEEAPILHDGCMATRQALDELLDESRPFDGRTLDYVNEFTTWAQDCLLKLRSEHPDVAPYPPAPWVQGDEDDDGQPLETLDMRECADIVNRIATELVLASAGSDDGLVPIYSLAGELASACGDNVLLHDAAQNLKAALDALLDAAKPFDHDTLDYVGSFTSWAQDALQRQREGNPQPPAFEAKEGVAPAGAEPEPQAVAATVSKAKQKIAAAEVHADDSAQAELIANTAKTTDVLLEISDEDKELLGEFQTEALEHLENIEAAVLTLENTPRDGDSLALIFRAFHTIKGVAGFLHLVPIQLLAHEVETLLDHARNHKLTLNSAMITLILKAKDTIQSLVDQITQALEHGIAPSEVIPVSHLIVAAQMASQEGLDIAAGRAPATGTGSFLAVAGVAQHEAEAAGPDEDDDEEEDETPAIASAAPASQNGAAKAPAARASSNSDGGSSTIRVKTGKLDNLMDMVGELVIVQSQLSESSKAGQIDDNSPLQRNISQLQRITRELQHTSMSLRLVPIKPTFQKVGRLVRDLAGTVGKKVNFVTEGEDTELDRNVVEQINDPLVHMIRNSLDHGLESKDDRIAAGKDSSGNISLKAYHQGSSIVIELRDDGRGIDPQKILKKARERGLVREDQNPNRADILNMIFEPGFSTAEKVSDISGRGVGMDVVRRNIEKLRGKVELDSEVGKGTVFKIKLPLTTAIIDGLVVRVGDDRFILPTTSVKVALRPEKNQISKIKGRAEVLDLRGKTIPLVRLHERFGIETEITKHWDGIVVIIETFGKPYGLLVDDMLSKQEVVIKSLGSMMKGVAGVAGGAILGDGTIALILDPGGLIGVN